MLYNIDTSYTIAFDVCPLCLGVNDLYCEDVGIQQFRKNNPHNEGWYNQSFFTGQKLSDEEAEIVVDEMLSIVFSHVMPMFERIIDWESWLNDVYRQRVNIGRWEVNIKIGNYGEAILILQEQIERIQNNLLNRDPDYIEKYIREGYVKADYVDEYRARCAAAENETRELLKFYTNLLERLSIPDNEYFNNHFAEQEAKAREYLSNPRKYKQKNGY